MNATHSHSPVPSSLLTRHKVHGREALPWLIAVAYYFAFPSHLGFGTELIITVLFALSLDFALGFAGIVTLGHAAFFGIGAYAVGILAKYGIVTDPVISLAVAAVAAGLVGLLSGAVLLRTSGLTFLMLTLCFMALLEEAANLGSEWTGGFDGLNDVPIKPLFGLFEFNPLYPRVQYLYALGVLFVGFCILRILVNSPFGQSLRGVRENVERMHAIGAPVRLRLVLCYATSAAIAGIAGAVWAQTNAYVNLSSLGLDRAATVLIILALGGYGHLYGAFIGAAVYMAVSHLLAKSFPAAWQLGLGLLLIGIALFARNGLIGVAEAMSSRFRMGRKA